MKVDQGQIEDIALIIARRVYGQDAADDQDRETARRILLDVAPSIARAERQRIAALVPPARLEGLAALLSEREIVADGAVQRDLRLLAMALRGREPALETVPA